MRKVLLSIFILVSLAFAIGDADAQRKIKKPQARGLACIDWNLDAVMDLADKAYKKERYGEARNLYRCSLSIVSKWDTYTPELSMTLQRLSMIYINVGNDVRAEEVLKRLIVMDEVHMGPYYRDVGVDAYLLGFIYADQGKFDKAEPMFKRALNIFEKQVSPNDRDIALMLNSLADVYRKTDRSSEAEQMESRAKRIEETRSI